MIRYPGSKDKIARRIMASFPDEMSGLPIFLQRDDIEYREPFFGAGAIGWDMLDKLPRRTSVWLNDKDYWLVCLWKSVKEQPRELSRKIDRFTPSTDAFYRYKESDGDASIDPVEAGFRKLALHQTSFSGLGAMAGGPIGGRRQSSEYNVNCRWSPTRLKKRIAQYSNLLNGFPRVRITSGDFAKLIDGAPKYAFIYADPPYYEKGPELYKHSLSDDDHRRLASLLRGCEASWSLSYDDHEFIRSLYDWAEITSVTLTYTTAVAKEQRRKNSEILISPRSPRSQEAA